MSTLTDDKIESVYKGNALMRLLSYMKPYTGRVTLCLILVLALTFFDLYRPTLIGDAIDLCQHFNQVWYCTDIKLSVQYYSDLGITENRTEHHSYRPQGPLCSYTVAEQPLFRPDPCRQAGNQNY